MTVARRREVGEGQRLEFMAMHWWFWYCTEA